MRYSKFLLVVFILFPAGDNGIWKKIIFLFKIFFFYLLTKKKLITVEDIMSIAIFNIYL